MALGWAIESPRVRAWGEGTTLWDMIGFLGWVYVAWIAIVAGCLRWGREDGDFRAGGYPSNVSIFVLLAIVGTTCAFVWTSYWWARKMLDPSVDLRIGEYLRHCWYYLALPLAALSFGNLFLRRP